MYMYTNVAFLVLYVANLTNCLLTLDGVVVFRFQCRGNWPFITLSFCQSFVLKALFYVVCTYLLSMMSSPSLNLFVFKSFVFCYLHEQMNTFIDTSINFVFHIQTIKCLMEYFSIHVSTLPYSHSWSIKHYQHYIMFCTLIQYNV